MSFQLFGLEGAPVTWTVKFKSLPLVAGTVDEPATGATCWSTVAPETQSKAPSPETTAMLHFATWLKPDTPSTRASWEIT